MREKKKLARREVEDGEEKEWRKDMEVNGVRGGEGNGGRGLTLPDSR